MTSSTPMPSARAAKVTAMRWRSTGRARALTSSTEGASLPSSSALTRTASIRLWLARGPGPQAICCARPGQRLVFGPAGADQAQDQLDQLLADRHPAHQTLHANKCCTVQYPLRDGLCAGGRGDDHPPLGLERRVVDVDLHEEPVELGFRQRVGAFLLDRVLRRQDMERCRQAMILTGNGHLAFLHRLQQRRLRAGARPVDLVRHEELGEDRAGYEAEALAAGAGVVEHLRAQDVGRHQVGGELHPFLGETQDYPQGLGQAGLGEARDTYQQRVTAGQNGDQRVLDHALLAEDDPADLCFDLIQFGDGGLDRRGDVGILVNDGRHAEPSGKRGDCPDSRTLHRKMGFGKANSREATAMGQRSLAARNRTSVAGCAVGGADPPDHIADIVGDQERTRGVDRHADGSAAGSSVLVEKAGQDVLRLARRFALRRTGRRSPCSRCAPSGSRSRADRRRRHSGSGRERHPPW